MKRYHELVYWIEERENVRVKKEAGYPKPWSNDMVFRTTYFCNVRREDDKVTRWIRNYYSPLVGHPWFDFNIVLARFVNWPETLEEIGFIGEENNYKVCSVMDQRAARGIKNWGSAYLITTHGIPMGKIDYLVKNVLPDAVRHCVGHEWGDSTLADAAKHLMKIEGVSTFLAGQFIADMKNTPHHPLASAKDWNSFALPGPGSRRGMDWLFDEKVPESRWYKELAILQDKLYNDNWRLHAQDIQNCLCEFDKFMRVLNGTGRSKRRYNGL